MTEWHAIVAKIVQGHRVASGLNQNPLFPGGTLRMQTPHFLARGFDLGRYFQGTVNVSIAPYTYRVVRPRHTFRTVQWHPTEPAEDFSFFDFRLLRSKGSVVPGVIYYPHPETKPAHVQPPNSLELLLPFVEGLAYDMELSIEIPTSQMVITLPAADPKPTFPAKVATLTK